MTYYGPQQGGYPQYPAGPPPRRNNTGLIVAFGGIALAAVVALVLVLVLDKDDNNSAQPGTTNKHGAGTIEVSVPGGLGGGGAPTGRSGSDSGGGGAKEVAERTAKAFESLSQSEISQVSCSASVGTELGKPFTKMPPNTPIQVTVKDVRESGSDATARMNMTAAGGSRDFTLEMTKKTSSWCVTGVHV